MLIVLLLVVLAAGQECPYCKWDACQTTWTGFGNCSACDVGALAQVQVYGPTVGYTQIIGVCQPCPAGCVTCDFGVVSPAMSIAFMAINCSQCHSGYTYNWSNGACAACAPNCALCECEGDTCWATYCETCALGYTLNQTINPPVCELNATNTTSLQTEEDQQTSGTAPSSHSGAIIGLSIWGAVMTVAAVVFVVLYWRQRDAKPSMLLGSESQVRQVTF